MIYAKQIAYLLFAGFFSPNAHCQSTAANYGSNFSPTNNVTPGKHKFEIICMLLSIE